MRSTFHIGAANILPRSDFIFAKQIFHVAKQHISGCSAVGSALLWATTPKRRRWRIQRGVVGAAVEIVRRSKAKTISGTARGQHRSAAGGGCSEVLLAQQSKLRAAPRRWQFRAPQEGEQSSANIFVLITNHEPLKTEYRGVAQLVARLLWEQDAGCSSHLTPTIEER